MNYHVLLNEQQSIYLNNINHVSTDEDTIRFCGKDAELVAAFKMYQIIGFYRVDVPVPEYKWDFETLDKHAAKQEEPTMHVDFYTDLTRKAREEYEGRDVSIGEIHEEMVEVIEEGMERRVVPNGGTIPLLVRKELNQRIRKATRPEEIKQLDKALRRNMNDCLGIE